MAHRFAARLTVPDFRNLGVQLRLLLLAEGLYALWWWLGALSAGRAWPAWQTRSALFEPALLTLAGVLALLAPWLRRRPPRTALAWTAVAAVAVALGWRAALAAVGLPTPTPPALLVGTLAVWAAVVAYFDWRHHRLSPALTEARLQALQSRMQPHFLFNSLNSVLALMPRDPARAEAMLEDLAELYRALLAEPRALVPLREELALARAYLAVEQVRLGERLRVAWHVDTAPADALLPPLTLQPLVENAVRHGVEPQPLGACVTIEAFRDDHHLVLFVRNPLPPPGAATRGHGLALANLRERLALHYDAEARLRVYESEGEFVVQVRLPIRAEGVSRAPRRSAS
ncbi:Sensor histidine kinase YehU [Tepidimonas thermarum]|uniref:Sensor histidine kinase YehU n=1 Tax=Tepidimonas thermarum TaxID=335431 RepID=A0A554WWR8_9BURK|nr:histidine kinase [Tepidimonas thermarum]TSE28016.1 Sensor histidine kinase YehU [Tepidimonas thermarum]